MCHLYAHADPILYESRNRSVRISKVVTSIKLENLFWDTLSELAREDGSTTNQLSPNCTTRSMAIVVKPPTLPRSSELPACGTLRSRRNPGRSSNVC